MKKQLLKKFFVGMALTVISNINNLNAQVGAALNFDGANDRVNLGTGITTSLTGSTKLTVEAWVRTTFAGNLGNIVSNYQTNNGGNLQFLLRRSANGPNGNFEFFVGNGGTWPVVATAANTSTNNVWMHVAGTWDGSVSRIYINGVLSGTALSTGVTNLGNAAGGQVWIGGSNSNEFHTGDIDEVRIWNIARSQADIQNSLNCEINGSSSNLIANYHFNQGIAAGANPTVTTLFDDSGNNFNGTLGLMTLSGASSNWVSPGGVTSGVSCNGAALNFDGTGDIVNVGTAITTSLISSNALTAEAWIKPESATGTRLIVGNHQFGATQFALRQTGTQLNAFVGFGTHNVNSAINTLTVNVWQHVAMVFNGTSLKTYINGVSVSTISFPSYTLPSSGDLITMGSNGFNESFDGDIDEVRIWKRALCQGEIQNNMMGQLSLPQSNLLGYYQFNNGIAACTNTNVTSLTALTGPTGTLQTFALTTGTTSNWVKPGGVSSTITVSAFISPTLAIASPTAICNGSSTTLTASGVSSYTWTSGPTTATFVVTPSVTTTYSVVGTNSVGCLTNVTTRTINVNATPIVSANNGTICNGSTFTIVPSGANTYTIQGGNALVSPTANASYTVIGTNSVGCVSANTATSSVTVNATPTVSANNGTICNGNTFTIVPSGANTYTIQGGNTVVSPTANASYTVIGTNSVGCVSANTATSSVTVNANPTVTTVSNASLICNGQTATLTASGANTYTWNTAATTSVIAVSLSVTTSYTVTGSSTNGCTNAITITQSVSACTGINANQLSNTIISVYPNPSNGEFTISTDADMNLSIVNNLGQVVKEISINSSNNYKASVSNLANGIYFVVGKNNDQLIKTKIVVSK